MPESTNAAEQRASVLIPTPSEGAELTVTSQPGGILSFTFDPAQATALRPEGTNGLVFELDNGGRVVITDFFAVGDLSLPDLSLPDGAVVATAEFFRDSDLDLSTAAGPDASPLSGGTSYDDNSGLLLAGLGKYGMLGTDYWARATEATQENDSLLPSLSFSLSIVTNPGQSEGPVVEDGRVSGSFRNMIFEDGLPNQHLDGYPPDAGLDHRTPGILDLTVNPGPQTSITDITLTGFAPGTIITIDGFVYSGGPLGAGASVSLTYEQVLFAEIAVYPPMDNSDADMLITANVTGVSGGRAVTESDSFTLVVDAVADLPKMELSDDITYKVNIDNPDAVFAELPFEVSFTDLDGSERHYIIIEPVSQQWTIDPPDWDIITGMLPEGWSLVGKDDPLYEQGIYEGNGWVLEVPGNVGHISGEIPFDLKTDKFEAGEVVIRGATWEYDPQDGEITTENNFAITELDASQHYWVEGPLLGRSLPVNEADISGANQSGDDLTAAPVSLAAGGIAGFQDILGFDGGELNLAATAGEDGSLVLGLLQGDEPGAVPAQADIPMEALQMGTDAPLYANMDDYASGMSSPVNGLAEQQAMEAMVDALIIK